MSGAKDAQNHVRRLIDELLSEQRPERYQSNGRYENNSRNENNSRYESNSRVENNSRFQSDSGNSYQAPAPIDWDQAAKEHVKQQLYS